MNTLDLIIVGGNGASPEEHVLLVAHAGFSNSIIVQISSAGQMWRWLTSIGVTQGYTDEQLTTTYSGFNTPGSHQFFAKRQPGMQQVQQASSSISAHSIPKRQSDPCGYSAVFSRLRKTDPKFEAAWLKARLSVATKLGPNNWGLVQARLNKEIKECEKWLR